MADQINNGVNVSKLKETVEAITGQPTLAKFTFRAENQWINGGHAKTVIKDFYGAGCEDTSRSKPFVIEADEPKVLLGSDHGANATEAVLHALACCLNTTLIYHAAARGIQIDELKFSLSGTLDLHGFLGLSDEVRNGFAAIDVTVDIKGNASSEQLEELCQLAQRRSPVFDMLSHGVPISVKMS